MITAKFLRCSQMKIRLGLESPRFISYDFIHTMYYTPFIALFITHHLLHCSSRIIYCTVYYTPFIALFITHHLLHCSSRIIYCTVHHALFIGHSIHHSHSSPPFPIPSCFDFPFLSFCSCCILFLRDFMFIL